jgi:chemotaxis protein histidine kinase CheA
MSLYAAQNAIPAHLTSSDAWRRGLAGQPAAPLSVLSPQQIQGQTPQQQMQSLQLAQQQTMLAQLQQQLHQQQTQQQAQAQAQQQQAQAQAQQQQALQARAYGPAPPGTSTGSVVSHSAAAFSSADAVVAQQQQQQQQQQQYLLQQLLLQQQQQQALTHAQQQSLAAVSAPLQAHVQAPAAPFQLQQRQQQQLDQQKQLLMRAAMLMGSYPPQADASAPAAPPPTGDLASPRALQPQQPQQPQPLATGQHFSGGQFAGPQYAGAQLTSAQFVNAQYAGAQFAGPHFGGAQPLPLGAPSALLAGTGTDTGPPLPGAPLTVASHLQQLQLQQQHQQQQHMQLLHLPPGFPRAEGSEPISAAQTPAVGLGAGPGFGPSAFAPPPALTAAAAAATTAPSVQMGPVVGGRESRQHARPGDAAAVARGAARANSRRDNRRGGASGSKNPGTNDSGRDRDRGGRSSRNGAEGGGGGGGGGGSRDGSGGSANGPSSSTPLFSAPGDYVYLKRAARLGDYAAVAAMIEAGASAAWTEPQAGVGSAGGSASTRSGAQAALATEMSASLASAVRAAAADSLAVGRIKYTPLATARPPAQQDPAAAAATAASAAALVAAAGAGPAGLRALISAPGAEEQAVLAAAVAAAAAPPLSSASASGVPGSHPSPPPAQPLSLSASSQSPALLPLAGGAALPSALAQAQALHGASGLARLGLAPAGLLALPPQALAVTNSQSLVNANPPSAISPLALFLAGVPVSRMHHVVLDRLTTASELGLDLLGTGFVGLPPPPSVAALAAIGAAPDEPVRGSPTAASTGGVGGAPGPHYGPNAATAAAAAAAAAATLASPVPGPPPCGLTEEEYAAVGFRACFARPPYPVPVPVPGGRGLTGSATASPLVALGAAAVQPGDPGYDGSTDTPSVSASAAAAAATVASVGRVGDCPLHWAADGGNAEIVRLLLAARSDPNQRRSDGVTALHIAATNGYTEVALALLEGRADVNAAALRSLTTPIIIAASFNRSAVTALLLAHGANPLLRNAAAVDAHDAAAVYAGTRGLIFSAVVNRTLGPVLEKRMLRVDGAWTYAAITERVAAIEAKYAHRFADPEHLGVYGLTVRRALPTLPGEDTAATGSKTDAATDIGAGTGTAAGASVGARVSLEPYDHTGAHTGGGGVSAGPSAHPSLGASRLIVRTASVGEQGDTETVAAAADGLSSERRGSALVIVTPQASQLSSGGDFSDASPRARGAAAAAAVAAAGLLNSRRARHMRGPGSGSIFPLASIENVVCECTCGLIPPAPASVTATAPDQMSEAKGPTANAPDADIDAGAAPGSAAAAEPVDTRHGAALLRALKVRRATIWAINQRAAAQSRMSTGTAGDTTDLTSVSAALRSEAAARVRGMAPQELIACARMLDNISGDAAALAAGAGHPHAHGHMGTCALVRYWAGGHLSQAARAWLGVHENEDAEDRDVMPASTGDSTGAAGASGEVPEDATAVGGSPGRRVRRVESASISFMMYESVASSAEAPIDSSPPQHGRGRSSVMGVLPPFLGTRGSVTGAASLVRQVTAPGQMSPASLLVPVMSASEIAELVLSFLDETDTGGSDPPSPLGPVTLPGAYIKGLTAATLPAPLTVATAYNARAQRELQASQQQANQKNLQQQFNQIVGLNRTGVTATKPPPSPGLGVNPQTFASTPVTPPITQPSPPPA